MDVVTRHLDQIDLEDVTVVVQDWGGPIGLRWAVEHADRVARLVVLNTGLFTGRVSKGFMAWREFAERTPDLPIGMIIQGATTTELPPEVVAAYEAPFPTPESKAGAQRFPLLVPLTTEDPGVAEMLATRDALGRWDKPALVAFSDTDPVFPFPRAGERFTELIPTAGEQVRIEGAAHFLQEDRGPRDRRRDARGVRAGAGLMPIEPDERQFAEVAALAGGDSDGPVVMLNLNRYRERAEYAGDPPGGGVRRRVGPRGVHALRRGGRRRARARGRPDPLAHRRRRAR